MITSDQVANTAFKLHAAAQGPEGTASRVMVRRDLLTDAAYLLADLDAERTELRQVGILIDGAEFVPLDLIRAPFAVPSGMACVAVYSRAERAEP